LTPAPLGLPLIQLVDVISALIYCKIFPYTSPPNDLELQPGLEPAGGGFGKKK